jgi:hypothetical protein
MTAPVEWPIVSRDKLVRAFQPGASATSEAPYRTLRRRRCATEGVAVRPRGSGRLQGQVRFFSRLNLRTARLARVGKFLWAEAGAHSAQVLEESATFRELRDHLAEMPGDAVAEAVAGGSPEGLDQSLVRAAAAATEAAEAEWLASSPVESALAGLLHAEVTTGYVSSVQGDVVWVRPVDGKATVALPAWLAAGARRGSVGDPVIVRTWRIAHDQAVVDVIPAIDLDPRPSQPSPAQPSPAEPPLYSPFNRADPRTTTITADDADRLHGPPAPLRVPVPVVIHE